MDSMKVVLPVLVALVILLTLAGCTQTQQQGTDNTANSNNSIIGGTEYTIEYTPNGYAPDKLTIKQGDTVKWVNKSAVEIWPAAAKPPTHEVYPGSSITKCGTPEEAGIFDACKGIPADESFSFTFNEVGQWFYHDHLDSTKFGQIIVE